MSNCKLIYVLVMAAALLVATGCSTTRKMEKSFERNAVAIDAPQVMPFSDTVQKYKVGLVLSGGGARGFAHAGAIKALKEFGITPEIISGTSAGAIAAALYANDMTPEAMMDVFRNIRFVQFPRIGRAGRSRGDSSKGSEDRYLFLNSTNIERILNDRLRCKTFEELKIPVVVNAVCLENGQNVYFHTGALIKPVIASSALPMAFSPVVIDGQNYVDGGTMQNLAVTPIRKICKYIIAINLNPLEDYSVQQRMYEKHWQRVLKLAIRANTFYDKSLVDLYVEPKDLVHYSIFDTRTGEDVFWIGYTATKKALEEFVKQHPDIVDHVK